MKYILLLMFFTTTDAKQHWQLQNTSTMEFDSKQACELAATGVWKTFKKIDAQPNAIRAGNMTAWCMAKGATQSSDIQRLNNVGQ
jgi:hypothetical protein